MIVNKAVIGRFAGYAWPMLLMVLLVLQVCLVAWIDLRSSPNPDETAHLIAGADIWRSQRFSLYPVNPPLVRAIAAMPVVFCCPDAKWPSSSSFQQGLAPKSRPEFSLGIEFVRNNQDRTMYFFALARLACIPFILLGGYFCWRWSSELYGNWAGVLAAMLWCFSPNVITWSATICPDVAAASLGLAACYCFWRWLKQPEWFPALLAGIALGAAELTKMTWIVLFVVWPVLWLLWTSSRRNISAGSRVRQSLQMGCILLIGICVLNLGYAFDGTFTKLRDYTFASRALAGADSVVDGGKGGNRFSQSWLGNIPVPLPKDYVEGVDLQKVDFERGLPSYLLGQWSQHGWWYYYIVCAVLKVPLGTWILAILAIIIRFSQLLAADKEQRTIEGPDNNVDRPTNGRPEIRAFWSALPDIFYLNINKRLHEVVLLLPAVAIIVFVSSQTGFSRHFRYVLPAFPFLFVWLGSVAQAALRRPRTIGLCAACSLAWMLVSSLSVYPHTMSYFNELAGGPAGGSRCLLDANIDWGQDILYLKEWCRKHAAATSINLALGNSYAGALLNLGDRIVNLNLDSSQEKQIGGTTQPREIVPNPGWYAVSIHRMHDPNEHLQYFQRLKPVAMAGYSIYIYHVTLEDAVLARKSRDLPNIASRQVAER